MTHDMAATASENVALCSDSSKLCACHYSQAQKELSPQGVALDSSATMETMCTTNVLRLYMIGSATLSNGSQWPDLNSTSNTFQKTPVILSGLNRTFRILPDLSDHISFFMVHKNDGFVTLNIESVTTRPASVASTCSPLLSEQPLVSSLLHTSNLIRLASTEDDCECNVRFGNEVVLKDIVLMTQPQSFALPKEVLEGRIVCNSGSQPLSFSFTSIKDISNTIGISANSTVLISELLNQNDEKKEGSTLSAGSWGWDGFSIDSIKNAFDSVKNFLSSLIPSFSSLKYYLIGFFFFVFVLIFFCCCYLKVIK